MPDRLLISIAVAVPLCLLAGFASPAAAGSPGFPHAARPAGLSLAIPADTLVPVAPLPGPTLNDLPPSAPAAVQQPPPQAAPLPRAAPLKPQKPN